jgi:sugar phosphate isomerase/epimerase
MRFGAMNFPVLPLLDEIDSFAGLGFDYLELAMDPPMAHHSSLSSHKNDVVTALRENGLGLVCHLPTFLSTADLTESLRRASVMEMLLSLNAAAELGAEKVVLHPSMAAGMGAFVVATVKEYAFDFLAEMVAAAGQLGLTICLENMFPRNLLGVDPDDFEEIFQAFPSLQLTLDTGHANIADPQGRRMQMLVQRFGKKLGHLHFSDNKGKRDDHLAIGEGNVNFSELARNLKAVGYDDTLTLEVFDKDRGKLVASRERLKVLFAG